MIGKITEKIMLKHVERKLGKYDIKLMHFIPGRIRLQSPIWKQNVLIINKIIAKLKEQILVYDVQFTELTGSLLIKYDASYVTDVRELESWFYIDGHKWLPSLLVRLCLLQTGMYRKFLCRSLVADFLSEHGVNYDKRKLNVYYSRGKIPKADVELAGTPYWSKSTVEKFCEQEKVRLKKD